MLPFFLSIATVLADVVAGAMFVMTMAYGFDISCRL